MRGVTVALLVVLPTLAGCIGGGGQGLVVVAQAPRLANGLSLALAVPQGLFGAADGTAQFWISHNGAAIYPPGGAAGAPVAMREGKGSEFVPYLFFVVENGDYDVTVEYNGQRSVATVPVEKWVRWVWPFAYLRGDRLIVDLVLEGSPGEPNHRIFAEGQLIVEIRYRGEDGRTNELRLSRTLTTDVTSSFQRLEFPTSSFRTFDQRGFYSIETTFHNFQAQGNNNVINDPNLGNQKPPTNWVHIG